MYKKVEIYFRKHPYFNSVVHVIAGAGVGVLATYPLVGVHPLRIGAVLLGLGVLGHLYPLMVKK